MVRWQRQLNTPLHVPPRKSTKPLHYPNTNKGTTSHHNNLEDEAQLADKEEDTVVVVDNLNKKNEAKESLET